MDTDPIIEPLPLNAAGPIQTEKISESSIFSEKINSIVRLSDTTSSFELQSPILVNPNCSNISFKFLQVLDSQDIEICTELFANITGTPVNDCQLHVGELDNTIHHILSVWNDDNYKIESLIGFVQVYLLKNCSIFLKSEGQIAFRSIN